MVDVEGLQDDLNPHRSQVLVSFPDLAHRTSAENERDVVGARVDREGFDREHGKQVPWVISVRPDVVHDHHIGGKVHDGLEVLGQSRVRGDAEGLSFEEDFDQREGIGCVVDAEDVGVLAVGVQGATFQGLCGNRKGRVGCSRVQENGHTGGSPGRDARSRVRG